MAVFPENMDKLNTDDAQGSFAIIENYIRYMTERMEFAMRNMTRTVTAAGISSAEVYILLTAIRNDLSALKSTVNGITGNVTSLSNQVSGMQETVNGIQSNVSALSASINRLEERVEVLEQTETT